MDLSSAESSLRTLKNRNKVPNGAIQVASELLELFTGSLCAPNPAHDPQGIPEEPITSHHDVALQIPSVQVPTNSNETFACASATRASDLSMLLEQKLLLLLLYGKERWEPVAVTCIVVHETLRDWLDQVHGSGLLDQKALFVDKDSLEKPEPQENHHMPFSERFLVQDMASTCHEYLEHYEPRLRMSVGKLLGTLAKWRLGWVYEEFTPQLIESVVCNLSRSPDYEETGFEELDDNVSVNGMETPPREAGSPTSGCSTPGSTTSSTSTTPRTPYRLDDVSGWKALESSLCAFKYIIQGSGKLFWTKHVESNTFVYMNPELLELLTVKSAFHINRHVRVVGLDTITSLCDIAPLGFLDAHRQEISDCFCKCLKRGLQDNWSQVRYAASIATRSFLMKLLPQNAREEYFPDLVPRICLNRYYIAERVQNHSLETWRMLMGTRGRQVVAQYASEIVEYYVEMTNHCVREAACHCIAELACKVDHDAIRPFVPRLLDALLVCFHDNSWLVRDAACLASSQFVLGFPEECLSELPELYHLWFDHLSDEIWSVREDAAVALGNVIRAYGQTALEPVLTITEEYLGLAKTQPAMTQTEYDEMLKSERRHSHKQAFSCCSLEPGPMKRHCEDHKKQPWEHTDGAIYVVRELCELAPQQAMQLLPQVADVAILRHFPQTSVLQETIWKQVPIMAQRLGKRMFKQQLEVFLDPLVFSVQGTNRLAHFAAKDCVLQLNKLIGPTIFQGRLQANPVWVEVILPLVHDTDK